MITSKDSLNWLNLQLIECIDALIQSVRQQTPSTDKILVAAFYKFVDWNDFKDLKLRLESVCEKAGTLGTILLAPEGINGTISGTDQGIQEVLEFLWQDDRLTDLAPKYSMTRNKTFYRMKIKLKKEIVSLGVPETKPAAITGAMVPPKEWNKVIEDPEMLIIDTRNDYEYSIGTFRNALNLNTTSFREFPEWVEKELKPLLVSNKEKKVAMFCTGGIRCEKASSYLLSIGFDEVLQLEGGILKYLEEIDPNDSQWEGECFVFDERVSLKHGLIKGEYDMCHACRMPIDENDKTSQHYVEGVSCPRCYDFHSKEKKEGFIERQKQIQIAKKQNKTHIGQKI